MVVKEIKKRKKELIEQGVRVKFVGDRSLFPNKVKNVCLSIENDTQHLKKLTVNSLFCYGARQEIVEGIKKIVNQIKFGKLDQKDITSNSSDFKLINKQYKMIFSKLKLKKFKGISIGSLIIFLLLNFGNLIFILWMSIIIWVNT